MKTRRPRARFPAALGFSLALHLAIVALVWAAGSRPAPLPPMRVYAVDIVSPPPQQRGEWSPEPVVAPDPVPATEPEAEEVEPEPTPPEPEPTPAPPARKKPEPEKPKPTPPKPEPARAAEEPKREPAKPRPSTGQNPDPASTGGEGLNYQLKGVQCPSPDYCNNIIRQVHRYFRLPGAATGEADLYFVINRDGSVSDIRVVRNTGGSGFRLAAMEAVEQAGRNKAFGPLPRAFPGDELPVSFFFQPAR